MSKFIDLFRQSPFQPLQEHMAEVMRCVGLIQPMFDAVCAEEYDKLEGITKEVFKSEHRADVIKDDIRTTIPKTFFLPVYRGDLLSHLKLQDDMADTVEDVAVLLTVKSLHLPKSIRERTMEYVNLVMTVCNRAHALTERFPKVLEHGPGSGEVESLLADVREVEQSEWEADRSSYTLSRTLFALEHEESPLDIMMWFKIFGELGHLANSAESIADRIRRMLMTT